MNIKNVILNYLQDHPGASSKRILQSILILKNESLYRRDDKLESAVFKKLRILKKEGKLHNNGNSWYVLNRKSS